MKGKKIKYFETDNRFRVNYYSEKNSLQLTMQYVNLK